MAETPLWSGRKRAIFGLPWTFTKYRLTDTCLFIRLDSAYIDFVLHKLEDSITLKAYITTMIPCYNGIMIYTKDKEKLTDLLKGLNL